jgi:hydroxymethylpyrimidine pyrophosphatase-like HAD family hydrolase
MNNGDRQRTIAVDFDGVLVDYNGWKGTGVLGTARADVIKALEVLRKDGWKVVIHTTRSHLEIAAFLDQQRVPYDEINQNSSYQTGGVKPVATVYWDDRAVCYSGDATKDLEKIRNFRTWSGRV